MDNRGILFVKHRNTWIQIRMRTLRSARRAALQIRSEGFGAFARHFAA